MAFGGKWINTAGDHTCPCPTVFGMIVNKQGSVWECDCGRRWTISREFGHLTWMPMAGAELDRADVLNRLARTLAESRDPDAHSRWRADVLAVLKQLEQWGMARWDADTTQDRPVP